MPRHCIPRKPRVRGDEERNALVTQWVKYAHRLARMAENRSSLLRSLGPEAVDDMAVDALLRAAELWDESKGKTFPSYLYQWVMMSLPKRACQAAKVRDRVPVADGLDPDYLPCRRDDDRDFEAREEVGRLMALLTGPQREALELLYFEGLPSIPAGRRLSITKSAVLFRRDRAFETIRRHVKG